MQETREEIIETFRGIYEKSGYMTSDKPGMENIMSNGSFDWVYLEEVADDFIEDEIRNGFRQPEAQQHGGAK